MLLVTTDSYFIPVLLLCDIGVSIIYNMGSNIFLGSISYITKSISVVLQLGVTTDFSIFLYHIYEQSKKKHNNNILAMNKAIVETFNSIIGSLTTTIAGFLALCSMQLTLGKAIGAGSKNIIVSITSLGIEESVDINAKDDLDKIIISYDTNSFKHTDIYLVVTPKLLTNVDYRCLIN